ncbi:MAG TPA: lysylphosphatidylglycerol synthase transmembrane domain-containing protein [Gaiellaceae bacterium]|nr:lysylphosphatidylglycerol synthase transmembrane domain-containing protein [Gaiellaceae bacterium]
MTRGRVLLALAGVAISAVFLWLAIRDADASAVREALEDAEVGFVLLAVAVFGVGYFFQAVRWRSIANTPQVGLRRFFEMVLAGLACNNVLPVRIGEVLRAGWLSRQASIPGGRALGSVALDRVCDVVALVVFLVIGLQAVPTPDWLQRIVVGALLALVVLGAALVFARLYTRSRERDRRLRGRVRQIARDTIDMLGEPIGRRRAAMWMGFSFVTWTLGSVAVHLVGRSVGIDLTAIESVFVASALALGVAIPSSPGYVGTYQWLGVASLGLLDVPVNEALAFAILMQASWYVPTTLAGGAILGWRALRMR